MNKKFNKFSLIDKLSRFRGIFPTRLNKLRFDANERVSEFENKFIQKNGQRSYRYKRQYTQKTC